jgi:hypothetical protein
MVVEYLLLRQHVSVLSLGHHQASPRLSIPTSHSLHLVHNHAHFTHGVHTPDIAYDLDFILLTIVNGHVINEISLDDMSYVNTTLYSLL